MILLPSESHAVNPENQALSQLDKRLIPEGAAFASLIINSTEEHQNTLFRVVFDAGSKSAWHSHPTGQILVIVRGGNARPNFTILTPRYPEQEVLFG